MDYPLSDLFNVAGNAYNAQSLPPEIQYFLDKGYISPTSHNDAGLTTYGYMGSQIPAAQTASGPQAFGSFWNTKGISGTAQLRDPNAVSKDTNYGDITSIYNLKHPEDTDFMSRWFPLIVSALATAGMGGAIGAVGGGGLGNLGGSLFNTAGKGLTSGGNDSSPGLQQLLQWIRSFGHG